MHDDTAFTEFVTFTIAGQMFGLPIACVQDGFKPARITRVPLAGAEIAGVLNLRGRIVTAIDMRRRLGLPPNAAGLASMNVVVRTADGAVSLLVDEIGDVVDMDASTCERPPDNLAPAARELIGGVYKLEDRLLLVLDEERAVDFALGRAVQ